MDVKDLIDAELTKNQAEVYLELIKKPEQSGGEIARSLFIDRSFTYGILNSLIKKGLVSYITRDNKKLFLPSDPDNLLKDIEEKRSKILNLVKELKSIETRKREEKQVRVYEGKSGLKAFIRDFLESPDFYTLGGGVKFKFFDILKYEYPHYLKELKQKEIKGKLITSPANKPIMKRIYRSSKVEIKTLDNLKGIFSFTVFRNKLAIYSSEEKPFVIIIEDKNAPGSLKNYFNLLWKIAKK